MLGFGPLSVSNKETKSEIFSSLDTPHFEYELDKDQVMKVLRVHLSKTGRFVLIHCAKFVGLYKLNESISQLELVHKNASTVNIAGACYMLSPKGTYIVCTGVSKSRWELTVSAWETSICNQVRLDSSWDILERNAMEEPGHLVFEYKWTAEKANLKKVATFSVDFGQVLVAYAIPCYFVSVPCVFVLVLKDKLTKFKNPTLTGDFSKFKSYFQIFYGSIKHNFFLKFLLKQKCKVYIQKKNNSSKVEVHSFQMESYGTIELEKSYFYFSPDCKFLAVKSLRQTSYQIIDLTAQTVVASSELSNVLEAQRDRRIGLFGDYLFGELQWKESHSDNNALLVLRKNIDNYHTVDVIVNQCSWELGGKKMCCAILKSTRVGLSYPNYSHYDHARKKHQYINVYYTKFFLSFAPCVDEQGSGVCDVVVLTNDSPLYGKTEKKKKRIELKDKLFRNLWKLLYPHSYLLCLSHHEITNTIKNKTNKKKKKKDTRT
ncbi:hypothetical protein RFI_14304 [Reticulomyxa filosa]|uniref:Uncharacterized protein n=1 Tax=Reticulomyxa filosa TaxID=46433 RepID=X6NAI7_RETFI|nr:hypothetical protein RFI_14304 [Reticulomyxa filosa]|eukprot:ETO22888.1 hypothetical protein RFI_14304 [Reticulomyxa filosa]